MSEIKKLAGQTIWYGGSSIVGRFISYLLTPYLSAVLSMQDYGRMGAVYAMMPLFNVLFTYGMETAFFRFVQKKENSEAVTNTATISLLFSTILFSIVLWYNQSFLAKISTLQEFPKLIQLCIIVIALDAFTIIPFARLRNEGRPKLFAFIKVVGIIFNVALTIFFISYCPAQLNKNPDSWVKLFYSSTNNPVTYVLWANIIQSILVILLLGKRIFPRKWQFDFTLWKKLIPYALPMMIVGLGGMVNETFDRLMLGWWLPADHYDIDKERGIYNACYKLSILITLFVQAFRMGAEPFFFKQAEGQNPQRIYARVMKFFVITITIMFLVVSLFMPIWRYFVAPKHWVGLRIVPILLLANMWLGIYYNLSVWYKVTNKTKAGALITFIGCLITILVNWIFIPHFSYMASAWATFLCYFGMMVISFVWGQKVYYVPYAWKKLVAYHVIVLILFFIHKGVSSLVNNNIIASLALAVILTGSYLWFILQVEKKEFKQMPFIGKFIK